MSKYVKKYIYEKDDHITDVENDDGDDKFLMGNGFVTSYKCSGNAKELNRIAMCIQYA